jgi:hypothetical protein
LIGRNQPGANLLYPLLHVRIVDGWKALWVDALERFAEVPLLVLFRDGGWIELDLLVCLTLTIFQRV